MSKGSRKARVKAKFSTVHQWEAGAHRVPPGFSLVRVTDWTCRACGTVITSVYRPSGSSQPYCAMAAVMRM